MALAPLAQHRTTKRSRSEKTARKFKKREGAKGEGSCGPENRIRCKWGGVGKEIETKIMNEKAQSVCKKKKESKTKRTVCVQESRKRGHSVYRKKTERRQRGKSVCRM